MIISWPDRPSSVTPEANSCNETDLISPLSQSRGPWSQLTKPLATPLRAFYRQQFNHFHRNVHSQVWNVRHRESAGDVTSSAREHAGKGRFYSLAQICCGKWLQLNSTGVILHCNAGFIFQRRIIQPGFQMSQTCQSYQRIMSVGVVLDPRKVK